MKYLQRSFSVPAANPGQDLGEWEAIFGTEVERKKKMAVACEETRKRRGQGKTNIVQLVGGATDGFTSQHSEMIDQMCASHNISPTLVKGRTREVFEKNADILNHGGSIQEDS